MPDGLDMGKSSSRAVTYAPLAILACLLWSSGIAVTKIGLVYVPPLTLAAMRYVLAGVLLLPFWLRAGWAAEIRRAWRFIVLVALLQTVIVNGLFIFAMKFAQGAQGAILIGASPLISALIAHFLMPDDRMGLAKTGVIALGLAGVAIVVLGSKPWQPTGAWELLGMGLILACSTGAALTNVVVARRRRPVNPILLNSIQMVLGGLLLSSLAFTFDGLPASPLPARFFSALAFLVIVSAATFSIWFALLRRVKVSHLSMWKFLIPVFGAIFSWLMVPGESPTAPMIGGMVLVAVAVVLNARQTDRPIGGRAIG